MLSDVKRRELFVAVERALGTSAAESLMQTMPPVEWADLARQADLVALRGEIAEFRGELKGEIAELRGELKGEMAELKGEMGELRGEMGELRGEMAELRSRVDAQFSKLVLANVPIMCGVAGLVLAAAKLA